MTSTAPALVLEVAGAPEVIAAVAESSDIRVISVDPRSPVTEIVADLSDAPSLVAGDVRIVRALLADEVGRHWLGGVAELKLCLPADEPPSLLVTAAADLAALGLRTHQVERVGPVVVVVAGRELESRDLGERALSVLTRLIRGNDGEGQRAEISVRERQHLYVQLGAALEREIEGLDREDALLTELRELRSRLRLAERRRPTLTGVGRGAPSAARTLRREAARVRRRVRGIVLKG